MSSEEVEEVKNEEATEIQTNEVIEEEPKEENKEETKEEPISNEIVEEEKPKTKPKEQPKKLARSVKVVELVECSACNKKMLPKSLRNTHPHYCKGAPTETLPVNKQKASYGSKVKEKLRKEIEEEMKAKYSVKEKQPQQEQIQKPKEPVDDVKTSPHFVMKEHEVSCSMREPEPKRIPTARELLEASYAEIRRAKREEQMQKINSFKSKMF